MTSATTMFSVRAPVRALREIRPIVFWPPAIILVASVVASLVDFDSFLAFARSAHEWILDQFGWLFSLSAFTAVVAIIVLAVSPIGGVRIGGQGAKPLLTRWNWFAITLCTTIATGILFWGTAEPIMHFNGPPAFANADPRTDSASSFALSTLYLHWSFTPYAMYGVPTIAFALCYYNRGGHYSLSAPLQLAGGKLFSGKGAAVIDSLALFALTAGVAASLGAGMMTLADGAARGLNLDDGPLLRLIVATVIVAVFTVSSVSGLQRGIKILSDLNIRIFFILAIFIFVAGPTLEIVKSASAGLVEYGATFLSRSVVHPLTADNQWQRDWTMFYYANWAAWAPITALFLGRISLGYTVREAILFNIVAPALFGILWMSIFGGAALELDVQSSQSLTQTLADRGPEAIVFSLLGLLPLASLMAPLFLFAMFISFVTAMDSNTHSIASVCLRANRQSDEVKGAGLWIKVFWGVAIGAVSWIMTSTNGIDGVKMLSNLGGAPGLVILLGCIVAIVRLILLGPKQLEQVKTAS